MNYYPDNLADACPQMDRLDSGLILMALGDVLSSFINTKSIGSVVSPSHEKQQQRSIPYAAASRAYHHHPPYLYIHLRLLLLITSLTLSAADDIYIRTYPAYIP